MNPKNMPTIRSYEQAEAIYASIKPIRGNPNDIRPLPKKRSYKYMRIAKHGDSYQAILYNTPCITWHKDGTIELRNGGFDSVTTAQFINEIVPPPMRVIRSNRSMQMRLTYDGQTYIIPPEGEPLIVKANDRGEYDAQNAVAAMQYMVNTRKARKVLAPYTEFLAWARGYISLRGMIPESEVFTTAFGKDHKNHPYDPFKLGMQLLNSSSYFVYGGGYTASNSGQHQKIHARKRLLTLLSSTSEGQPKSEERKFADFIVGMAAVLSAIGRTDWRQGDMLNHRTTTPASIRTLLIKLHAPEIVEEITLPLGRTPKTNIYKTWMQGWIKEAYDTDSNS